MNEADVDVVEFDDIRRESTEPEASAHAAATATAATPTTSVSATTTASRFPKLNRANCRFTSPVIFLSPSHREGHRQTSKDKADGSRR